MNVYNQQYLTLGKQLSHSHRIYIHPTLQLTTDHKAYGLW